MGPLGYQSDAQMSLAVSYNCLRNYAGSLHHALTEPYPPYEAIGVQDGDGHYRQLATTLLQIENEFYGTIRPKRRIRRGERPLHALTERGVEYVEVRSLDVDPFSPAGIDPVTMRFLDVFLLHCLLTHSPPDTREEIGVIAQNQYRVAERGREPGVRLQRDGVETALAEWGIEVLRDCAPIAAALDEATRGRAHRDALAVADERLRDPERTPSARVLAKCEGASTTRISISRSPSRCSIAPRSSRFRCRTQPPRGCNGWPTSRWRCSGRSRQRTACRSRPIGGNTWRRTS